MAQRVPVTPTGLVDNILPGPLTPSSDFAPFFRGNRLRSGAFSALNFGYEPEKIVFEGRKWPFRQDYNESQFSAPAASTASKNAMGGFGTFSPASSRSACLVQYVNHSAL
jgi:hypothetical protein